MVTGGGGGLHWFKLPKDVDEMSHQKKSKKKKEAAMMLIGNFIFSFFTFLSDPELRRESLASLGSLASSVERKCTRFEIFFFFFFQT